MAFGASRTSGSGGENVNHFNAVRLRLQGTGNLKMKLWSMDDMRSVDIAALPMHLTTNIQPTRPSNIIEQRVAFEFKTTEINEYLKINRIILFARQFGTEYPSAVNI